MKKLRAIIALPILTIICIVSIIIGALRLLWIKVEKYACVLIDWASINEE